MLPRVRGWQPRTPRRTDPSRSAWSRPAPWVRPSVAPGSPPARGCWRTVDGRSERTRSLAHGLELVADLDAVVAESDLVVSVVPPGAATVTMTAILDAAAPWWRDSVGGRPQRGLPRDGRRAGDHGHGGRPRVRGRRRQRWSPGARRRHDALPVRVRSERPGRPHHRRPPHAGRGARAGVGIGREDVHGIGLQGHAPPCGPRPSRRRTPTASSTSCWPTWPTPSRRRPPRAGRLIALATSKSARFVAEMEQISATQGAAGASPELFAGMAAVYARLSTDARWPT